MTATAHRDAPRHVGGGSQPLLHVEDLLVRFRTHDATIHAVNGISFDLEEGETLGLVGESGCGKSVTSLAIMRLLPKPAGKIDGGRVLFEGQDVLALDESDVREMRGRDIAMIFQDPMTSLNPVLTIEEQLVETIRAHRKITKDEARARAIELLGTVGIPKPETRLKSYPHQFSGGMRQRVMIAMALSLEPKLLIADEPTTALDVTIQAQVLELIRDLTERSGTAVILITHDLGVVAGMTQRLNVMYAGFIVETGTTADVFEKPSHPYTVGLLHSIPRVDAAEGSDLIPIEGTPPNQRQVPVGCLFAPRCAWRVDRCATETPGLEPVTPGERLVLTGAETTHRLACWNSPTAEEATAGRPLGDRAVFVGQAGDAAFAALVDSVPAGEADAAARGYESEDASMMLRRGADPLSTAPSAAGLPLEPDRRGDR
jgi:oligopeptide transport system ATP-binding protein